MNTQTCHRGTPRALLALCLAVAGAAAGLGTLTWAPAAHAQAATAGDDDDERQADYWDEKNRGWFFYERKKKKPKPKPPVPLPPVLVAPPVAVAPPPADPASGPKHPDLVRFEALQKRVEETRNIAIMTPTEENIKAFLYAQQEVLDRAEKFGKASTQVVWATPQLNPEVNGNRPTTPSATRLYDQQRVTDRQTKFAQLSQTHAFFLFFRSDCQYCHRLGPVLMDFSRRTGIRVMAISMDGRGMPGVDDFKADNGISARFGVQQVPALYLTEPRTGKVLPVGYGVLTPTELENRVDAITSAEFETNVPSAVQQISELQAQR